MPKVLEATMPEFEALRDQIAELTHDWEDERNWGAMSDADKQEYRDFAARVLALPGLQRLCALGRIWGAAESAADLLLELRHL